MPYTLQSIRMTTLLLACALTAPFAAASDPPSRTAHLGHPPASPTAPPAKKLQLTIRPAPGLSLLQQGRAEDTGQSYYARDRRIRLFRSRTAFALRRDADVPTRPHYQLRRFADPNAMARARASFPSDRTRDVYITEDTADPLIVTDRFVARLAAAHARADLERLAALHNLRLLRSLHAAPDTFILQAPGRSPEQLLALANLFHENPSVEWACPDFAFELQLHYTPADPLFAQQWHLHNTGQFFAVPGADIAATDAWDRLDTPRGGSPDIVIAIIDTGVQITHPDLDDNIHYNPAEVTGAPGIDDDNNGFIDDFNGWDFYDDDNNPNATSQPHGTACAGLVAAEEGNALGGTGLAFHCAILPVKVTDDNANFASSTVIADAIRYAADNAHVLSNSWGGGGDTPIIHDAIQYAVNTRHRPVFFAAGNDADGTNSSPAWIQYTLSGFPTGTFTFRWQYSKDISLAFGEDSVWLDEVFFPGDSGVENFENEFPPVGWITGGNSPWHRYDQSDHVRGRGCRSAQAGTIKNRQSTWLETTRSVNAGELVFYAWTSSEADYDFFEMSVNSTTYFADSGVPIVNFHVAFPAAYAEAIAVGAATDFDRRSPFSQFDDKDNQELDFVAPSNGGNASITTTDLTGSPGYNTAGDYTSVFGGTSAACPLAAGLGALVLSKNPNLDPEDLRAILQNSADPVGCLAYTAGYSKYMGHGRLNACNALAATPPLADFEPDLDVDLADYAFLLDRWQHPCTAPLWCDGADLNRDTRVNLDDLAILANLWLDSPSPCD